jgi:hypothetical protein
LHVEADAIEDAPVTERLLDVAKGDQSGYFARFDARARAK